MKTAQQVFLAVLLLLTNTDHLYAQWVLSNGRFDGRVYSFAVMDTNMFAAEDGGILRSTDGGASWKMLNSSSYFDALAVKDTNLFVGSYSGVYLSTDNGTSWNPVNNGLLNNIILSLAFLGKDLFAGTGGSGVFLSTNNGTSWTSVSSGLTNFTIWALYVSGSNLFAGTQNGMFLTTDNGSSWTPVNNGLTNGVVDAFIGCGNNIFAATWGGGIFVSTNNGNEWKAVNTGLQNYQIISFAASGTSIFAGSAVGVFQSTDMGSSWKAVSNGLVKAIVYSLTIYEDYLLAGTAYQGVWRRPLSEMITGIKDEQNNPPVNYSLSQNYPNPFNPATIINYSVPSISMGRDPVSGGQIQNNNYVTLKVYDLLGNLVKTLVDGYKAQGNYSVNFNAGGLASGVYLYRLQAGNYLATKKLILMK